MRTRSFLLLLTLATIPGSQASAQVTVFDPSSYAKATEEAQTALSQLEQLKQQVANSQTLLTSLNRGSNVGDLASLLSQPQVRAFLPDTEAFAAAARGDLTQLGSLSASVRAIRDRARLYTPQTGDALGAEIDAEGDRAALDLAAAHATSVAAQTRLIGLEQLQASVSGAGDIRAVVDLQARIQAEQAMIANDQMRLQGLAMAQTAEDRMQRQRDRERMEAERDARIALYKAQFQ